MRRAPLVLAVLVLATAACLTAPAVVPPSSVLAYDNALVAMSVGGAASADGVGPLAAVALRSPAVLRSFDESFALHGDLVADTALLGGYSEIPDASFWFASVPLDLSARALVDVTPHFTGGVELGFHGHAVSANDRVSGEGGPTLGVPLSLRFGDVELFTVPRIGVEMFAAPGARPLIGDPVGTIDASLGFRWLHVVFEVGERLIYPKSYSVPEYYEPYAVLTWLFDVAGAQKPRRASLDDLAP